MVVLTKIPFTLDTRQLAGRLRIEDGSGQAAEFENLIDMVREVGNPKALYEGCYIDKKDTDSVTIDGIRFTSPALRKDLDKVERVFPGIATCGKEMDDIKMEPGDFKKKSWLSVLKANLLMTAIQFLHLHIMEHYKIPRLAFMNPGSGDAEVWPIEQQKDLLLLFDDIEGSIGVKTDQVLYPDAGYDCFRHSLPHGNRFPDLPALPR